MPAPYLFLAREHNAALERGRDAVRRLPESDYAHFARSQIASALRLNDEAISEGRPAKELAPDKVLVHTSLASALAIAGRYDESRAEIDAIESSPGPTAPGLACAGVAGAGKSRACDRDAGDRRGAGAPQYVYTFYDPRLAALRDALPVAAPTTLNAATIFAGS